MASEVAGTVRFGVFELDRRSGELRKQGVRIRLRTQSYEVLTLLLDRAGEVVTREELQRHVWPAGTFVDFERGLNKAVNRLRDALGDTADSPRFIETLPKRGYRFIAPVERGPGPVALSAEPMTGAGVADVPTETARVDPGLTAQRRRGLIATGAMVLAAIAAVGYGLWLRPSAVATEPVRIVLADFDNSTGDPAFDHTLEQALVIDLEQSPAVRIVSAHEVMRVLRLMQRAPTTPLTADIARDVCRRANGRAVLGGSLTALGSEYVLGLQAIDCATGEPIARHQARASRKEEVLSALDSAASAIRPQLGESRSSIERFDKRVHDMLTTGSLEAFAAYTSGERNVFARGGWTTVPFFLRAIELDPEFAYAHASLGLILGTLGESARSRLHAEKAYQLRDRVSEWERFFITVQYHDRVTGELDRVLSECDLWIQTYPQDRTAHNRLANAYNQLGQAARARTELERARGVGRDHPIDVDHWAATSIRLNREQDALPVIRQEIVHSPDRLALRRTAYRLAFVAGDTRDMAAHIEWAMRTPRAEALFADQSQVDMLSGRLDRSRHGVQRAVGAAVSNGFAGNAGVWTALHAVLEALLGNDEDARAKAREAVALEASWETRALAAVALAHAGDGNQAQELADKLHAERPRGTLVQNYWLPVIRAEMELGAGNPSRALEWLRAAEPHELSDTRLPLLPAFVRGTAYLSAHDGHRATEEFQKLLKHRGVVGYSPLGVLAQLGNARALALVGNTAEARAQYEALFQLWRDADSGFPLVTAARTEYKALQLH